MPISDQLINVIELDGTTKQIKLYTEISDVTEVYKDFLYNGQTLYASTTTDPNDEYATGLKYVDGEGVVRYLCTETPLQGVTRNDRTPSDLTVLFKDEIANQYGGNVWSLVTDKNNAESLVVGDWIPIEVGSYGYTYDMEIACINCYEGECYDNANPVSDGSADGAVTKVPSHIDLISKQLYNIGYYWYGTSTSTSSNMGSANQQCPWLHSDLYVYLQDTVFPLLPQQLQDAVIEKCMLIEQRYSSGASYLTSPTGECWQPIGKLWIPNEVEIFGSASYSSTTYGNYGVQYETFDSSSKRIRYVPFTSSVYSWWSLSPNYGGSRNVVYVNTSGSRDYDFSCTYYSFPLCVRVEIK